MGWVTGRSQCKGIICTQAGSGPQAFAFAASVSTRSPRPSLWTSCCCSKGASTSPTLATHPLQSPQGYQGWYGATLALQQTRTPLHPQPWPSLLHALSTSKPGSAQVGDVERPSNAMSIARPPGIRELLINSSPKPAFADPTRFSIQKPSRLCHLAAFCRQCTLLLGSHPTNQNCLEGAKPPGSPRVPSARGLHITPCMECPATPGAMQNPRGERCRQPHEEARVWGILLQVGLLLGKWFCARGQPLPAAHQHSRDDAACRATN